MFRSNKNVKQRQEKMTRKKKWEQIISITEKIQRKLPKIRYKGRNNLNAKTRKTKKLNKYSKKSRNNLNAKTR